VTDEIMEKVEKRKMGLHMHVYQDNQRKMIVILFVKAADNSSSVLDRSS
jgi:hypothetical protein